MTTNKIFIIGSHSIDKLKLAKLLVEKDDNLSIGEHFTNDIEYKDIESDDNYIYYLDSQEIDMAYKNNVILCVNTDNYISNGIMMDCYYNNDIFTLSIQDFNNISNTIFNSKSNDILVIWVDAPIKDNSKETKLDIFETKYLLERINNDNIKYMYFLNEDFDTISDIILEYLEADDIKKSELLDENS